MKRIHALLLSILSLILVLSACGNAGGAHQQYNTAMDLWASGQQYEAVKLLTKNPTYKDSWDYIKEFYQAVGEKIKVSVGRTVGLRADGTVLDTKSNYAVSKWSGIVQIASDISVVAGLTDSGRVAFIQEDIWTNEVASSGYISGWTNIRSITSDGIGGIVGITESGSVLMEGRNDLSSFDLSQLSGAVSIEDSGNFLAGLLPDGTVAITGNTFGRDFSDVSDWTDIIEISAKDSDIIGLRADGTPISAPADYFEKTASKVSEWTDIVSVCAIGNHNFIGLKSDGTIVITTDKWDLSDWSNVVTIAGNSEHIVALRSDGTVLTKGNFPRFGGLDAAAKWTDIVALADAADHLVGLKSDGTVVAAGDNDYGQCNLSTWRLFNDVNNLSDPFFDSLDNETTSQEPLNINTALLADIGRTYKEMKEQYGDVVLSDSYEGGQWFKFEDAPDVVYYFVFNDVRYEKNPDDNAECYEFMTSANILFPNLESVIPADVFKQDLLNLGLEFDGADTYLSYLSFVWSGDIFVDISQADPAFVKESDSVSVLGSHVGGPFFAAP